MRYQLMVIPFFAGLLFTLSTQAVILDEEPPKPNAKTKTVAKPKPHKKSWLELENERMKKELEALKNQQGTDETEKADNRETPSEENKNRPTINETFAWIKEKIEANSITYELTADPHISNIHNTFTNGQLNNCTLSWTENYKSELTSYVSGFEGGKKTEYDNSFTNYSLHLDKLSIRTVSYGQKYGRNTFYKWESSPTIYTVRLEGVTGRDVLWEAEGKTNSISWDGKRSERFNGTKHENGQYYNLYNGKWNATIFPNENENVKFQSEIVAFEFADYDLASRFAKALENLIISCGGRVGDAIASSKSEPF